MDAHAQSVTEGITTGCTARPSVLHCTSATLRDSSHSYLSAFSTLLYGCKHTHFQPLFIYLFPLSLFHLCLKTSATLNPPGIYSLNQFISNDLFWVFVFLAFSIYLNSPAALLPIQNNLLLFFLFILTSAAMRLALHSNVPITPGDNTVPA